MHRTSLVSLLFGLVVSLILLLAGVGPAAPTVAMAKKKGVKDWSKVKAEDIDRAWESDDDPQEKESTFEAIRRREEEMMARARGGNAAGNKGKGKKGFDPNSPESYIADLHSGKIGISGGKAAMFFAVLAPTDPSTGKAWTNQGMEALAGTFSRLLQTAGLNSDVYNLGPSEKENQLLVSVTKGWLFNDVMKFALSRPEVLKAVYNSQDYHKGFFGNDDEL